MTEISGNIYTNSFNELEVNYGRKEIKIRLLIVSLRLVFFFFL